MSTSRQREGLAHKVARASKSLWYRTYSDFLMSDRLDSYEALIQEALERGYRFHSILSFFQLLVNQELEASENYVVLRHDVDTDTATARQMWGREVRLGIRSSSYYFRLSTLDIPLMQEIQQAGHEASYHYEELSEMVKAKGFSGPQEVAEVMPRIKESFRRNITRLRETTGLPMLTVAAHGDFVNRRLGISNQVILEDLEFRRRMNILAEAYDETLMRHVTSRHSDTHYPYFWLHGDPEAAIRSAGHVVHILMHPRHWHASVLANIRDDAERIWQDVAYRVAVSSQQSMGFVKKT
jgi:hypothetical protein